MLQAVAHSTDSHTQSHVILNPKQRGAIVRAVKAVPLSVGSQVLSNLQNFSPGKHVLFDHWSRGALNQLVRSSRSEIMASSVPWTKLDGSNGSMNQLTDSLSLAKFIERHDNQADAFHLT